MSNNKIVTLRRGERVIRSDIEKLHASGHSTADKILKDLRGALSRPGSLEGGPLQSLEIDRILELSMNLRAGVLNISDWRALDNFSLHLHRQGMQPSIDRPALFVGNSLAVPNGEMYKTVSPFHDRAPADFQRASVTDTYLLKISSLGEPIYQVCGRGYLDSRGLTIFPKELTLPKPS
jgi:hypothetical protein